MADTEARVRHLTVKRSLFLQIAPLFLWALAAVIPFIAGNAMISSSLDNQFERRVAQTKQLLLTRAQEFESQFSEDRLVMDRIRVKKLYTDYYYNIASVSHILLAKHPTIQAMPDFSKDIESELLRYADYFKKNFGFVPLYLLALDRDPEKCGFLFSSRFRFNKQLTRDFKIELSKMCRFFDRRSLLPREVAPELRHFGPGSGFPIYMKSLGIFNRFPTLFYDPGESFSSRINERIYQLNLRYPDPMGDSNYIIVGTSLTSFSFKSLLKQSCRRWSDKNVKVTFGQSEQRDLPKFIESTDNLQLLTNLPAFARNTSSANQSSEETPTVLSFKFDILTLRQELERKKAIIKYCFLIVSILLFIFSIRICLQRSNSNSGLNQIIAVAFTASMLFPIMGTFQIAYLQSMISKEVSPQKLINRLALKLKEIETGMLLQNMRRQLLIAHFTDSFKKSPMKNWKKMVENFSLSENSRKFEQHIGNFYLYAKNDQEYYRGKEPGDRYRINELPKILAGHARRLLLNLGSFRYLPENQRQKIVQLADFSTGVMEQLIDTEFIGTLWKEEGNDMYGTFIAKRNKFTANFIKDANDMKGILVTSSDNLMIQDIIVEMIETGRIQNVFNLDGFKVELHLFPVSDFEERGLRGKILFSSRSRSYIEGDFFDQANALYADSDQHQINNLNQDPPHIIVTDTIFDRSAFAYLRATPLKNSSSEAIPAVLLALAGLISCIAWSIGISRLLLQPVKPLVFAINEINRQNFAWTLRLRAGDEFTLLGESMNSMKTSLLERQKMMQLVSKNVIEASQTSLSDQKQPQKRKATILFSDIRGFTTISETHPAEEVVEMLNSYFTLMCPIIEENGGFVDKLIGDAIQAVFYGEDDRQRVLLACRTALRMRQQLALFNQQRTDNRLFTIENGIGIASGEVTTGLVGSDSGKLEAAVIGEAMSHAATLESKSKTAMETHILIDTFSFEVVRDLIRVNLSDDRDNISEEKTELIELTGIIDER